MPMRRFAVILTMICAVLPAAAGQQLSTPSDWKWRQDSPAPLAPGATLTPGSWVFVQMPPGWHITTGPGAILYPSAHGEAEGNFSVETEIHLFPGTAPRNSACSWAAAIPTARRLGTPRSSSAATAAPP